jgi:hypothetical protein
MHQRLMQLALARDASRGVREIKTHIGSTAKSMLAILGERQWPLADTNARQIGRG